MIDKGNCKLKGGLSTMLKLKPKEYLTEAEVQKGLRKVIWDGLTAEAMTALTSGTFLVALALLIGANSFQIGILASLPLATNVFQLLSVWLVSEYQNRRAVAVFCAYLARLPLLIIGLGLLYSSHFSLSFLFIMLTMHYLFGSIAGPSWNSWMKDMIPEQMLGTYFSKRGRYTQTLNVILSIILGFILDYVKVNQPANELTAYAYFFLTAGLIGIIGGYILSRVPETIPHVSAGNVIQLFKLPLMNQNFRRVLIFNSFWAFALNIATPFLSVFMLTALKLSISYIILLGVISQLAGILTISIWGTFSDRYSNKSIISLAAPIYIAVLIGWCYVGIFHQSWINILLLLAIHIATGVANSGINLSITNIGLKLAPKRDAIVFLSVKNIVVAISSSLGPLVGGVMAAFFLDKTLSVNLSWMANTTAKNYHLLSLQQWSFLFIASAILALVSLNFLIKIKELGEVPRKIVRRIMRTSIRNNMRDYFLIGNIISLHDELSAIVRKRKYKTSLKEKQKE